MKALKQWYHSERAMMGSSVSAKAIGDRAIDEGNRYHRRMFKLLELHKSIALPKWRLLVEPWFHTAGKADLCSPDSVLVDDETKLAIVIEVKKNWATGRDQKLLDLYLPVVASALGVKTKPLMLVGNVRGLKHEPLTSMTMLTEAPMAWLPGMPTPTLLRP